MGQIEVLQCEDSVEGVFTGIYEAYRRKLKPEETVLTAGEEKDYRLFAHYDSVAADGEKAQKVMRTLKRRFGEPVCADLCIALAVPDEQKAEAVYRCVAKGLLSDRPQHILEDLADPFVHRVFTLARSAWNEVHRWKQFLRFRELNNHILLAEIGPQNDVLAYLAPHFADRLPLENFAIYDKLRDRMVLHPAEREWYLVSEAGCPSWPSWCGSEEAYQELFRYFCHKIGIEERKNSNLQQQMVPLYFQNYMLEFDEKRENNRKML